MCDLIKQKVGVNIQRAIKIAGYTQKEVSQLLGISENSVVNYIKGKRIPDTVILFKLAEICKINANDLVPMDLVLEDITKSVLNDQNYTMGESAKIKWEKYIGKAKTNIIMEQDKKYNSTEKQQIVSIEYLINLLETIDEKQQQKIFLKLIINWQVDNLNKISKIINDVIEFKGDHKK